MKKPIDPNLNSFDNEDILFGTGDEGQRIDPSIFELNEKKKDPHEKIRHSEHLTQEDFEKARKYQEEKEIARQQGVSKPVQKTNNINTQAVNDSEDMQIVEKNRHHQHHHSHHGSSGHHHSHHSSHHHSSKHSKKRIPKILKAILIILLILALLITGLGATYTVLNSKGKLDLTSAVIEDDKHQEIISYNGHKYEFNKNIVSVAFMGVDQRELVSNEETDYVGCADADIVIAIDTVTGKVKVIAIPRDTMVDVDQYSNNNVFLGTSRVQLCLAYAYGDGKAKSCNNVVDAMSRVLYNVPIQKYFALDLDGIAPINDAVGGVTVDPIYSIPSQNVFEGKRVTLRGDMAEAYVRSRDMDTIDASLNRTDRQVQYIKSFAAQLLPAVRSNFNVVSDLYSTASSYSKTNITLNNATYIASLLLSKGIGDFETYTLKGKMTPSKESPYPNDVFAEFTPDEDSVMDTVINVYYNQID